MKTARPKSGGKKVEFISHVAAVVLLATGLAFIDTSDITATVENDGWLLKLVAKVPNLPQNPE